MCNNTMLEWRSSREDSGRKLGYLIHGHIHNRISDEYRQLFLQFNALNAGVDVNGYAPVTFDELVANNLEFKLKALSSEEDREVLKTRFALFEKRQINIVEAEQSSAFFSFICLKYQLFLGDFLSHVRRLYLLCKKPSKALIFLNVCGIIIMYDCIREKCRNF